MQGKRGRSGFLKFNLTYFYAPVGKRGEGRGGWEAGLACGCRPWVLTADSFSLAPNARVAFWGPKGKEGRGFWGWARGTGMSTEKKRRAKRHTFGIGVLSADCSVGVGGWVCLYGAFCWIHPFPVAFSIEFWLSLPGGGGNKREVLTGFDFGPPPALLLYVVWKFTVTITITVQKSPFTASLGSRVGNQLFYHRNKVCECLYLSF